MSKLNKGQRQLHHTSASSVEIAEGYPNVKEGNEGDITLRHIKGQGVYIFVKFRNRWYSRQLFSGQGRNTGVKESNLENPSARQQLNFYDPKSRKTFPVDTSEVLTVKFGSPGKLSLGGRNASSEMGGTGNPGQLLLGDDSKSSGVLMLGKGTNGISTIASGMIDSLNGGILRLLGGQRTSVGYPTILNVGSDGVLASMKLEHISIQSPYGPVLSLRECENIGNTEIISDTQNRDISSNSDWVIHNPASTGMSYTEDFSTDNRLEITPTSGNSSEEGVQLPTTEFTDLEAGNTYMVTAKVYVASGTLGGNPDTGGVGYFYFRLGGVKSSSFTLTTTSVISKEILVTSNDVLQIFGEVDTTTQWFVDDISIKKIVPLSTGYGGLYVERQSSEGDGVLKFRNSNGDISTLSSSSASTGYLPLAGGTVTGTVHMDDDVKIEFGDAGEYITGNGSDLYLASSGNLYLGSSGSLNIDVDGWVEFDGCGVGFDLVTPTYNASDTDVDFQTGNKQFVTFGSGNITDLNLIFPKVSGNFTLLLKQDGTGSRTVTNYKVWDRANTVVASGSSTVKFAGGSNPTLTTDANHVDIISFFYDADNEIAYGVATLDFQF